MTRCIKKRAGVWSDYWGSIPSSEAASAMMPNGEGTSGSPMGMGILQGMKTAGLLDGIFSQKVTDKDIEEMDKNTAGAYIPGASEARIIKRLRHMAGKTGGEHADANIRAEQLGMGSIPVFALTVAGGLIGALLSRGKAAGFAGMPSALKGGLIGAGAGLGGSLLASLAGFGLAGITPTRTREEQREHDSRFRWAGAIIPGVVPYDKAKRFGRLLAEERERNAKKKQQG